MPLPRSSFSGQVDGIIKGVLGQSKESNPLSACHETTSPDWLVHVETDEQLGRLGKEVSGLGGDLRVWDVAAGEVLQLLDLSGEILDVVIQPVGLETIEDSGTEGVRVDTGVGFETASNEAYLLGGDSFKNPVHEITGEIPIPLQRNSKPDLVSTVLQGNLGWVQWMDIWVDGCDWRKREETTKGK